MSLDPKDANRQLTEREQKYVYEISRLRALLDQLDLLKRELQQAEDAEDLLRDKLQRAEVVVKAAGTVVAQCSGHMTPSMGDVFRLEQALAAWEEGKV